MVSILNDLFASVFAIENFSSILEADDSKIIFNIKSHLTDNIVTIQILLNK